MIFTPARRARHADNDNNAGILRIPQLLLALLQHQTSLAQMNYAQIQFIDCIRGQNHATGNTYEEHGAHNCARTRTIIRVFLKPGAFTEGNT